MGQEQPDYVFKVQYEYKIRSKRHQIFSRIAKNFILPFWIENKNFSRFNLEKEQINKVDLDVIDSRQFKVQDYQKSSKLSVLYHEIQEFKEYLQYEENLSDIKDKLIKSDSEQLQKMISLPYIWLYVDAMLNKVIKKTNFISYKNLKDFKLDVGLFERTIQVEQNDQPKGVKKQKKKYLLLKFPETIDNKKQTGQKYSIKQTEYIISLQDFNKDVQKQFELKIRQLRKTKISTRQQAYQYAEAFIQNQNYKLYPIKINFESPQECEDIPFQRSIKLNGPIKNMIKLLTITFKINDPNKFIENQIKNQSSSSPTESSTSNKKSNLTTKKMSRFHHEEIEYHQLNQIRTRNIINFPFKEYVFKRQKKYFDKHFSLAFQGGGAKGLAYVGAYKALKEIKNDKQQIIPVKSIIGSSAGGIIALAVSTGIPDYQLQKICFKMKEIPSTDRFVQNENNTKHTQSDNYNPKDTEDPFTPRDLDGLQIRMQDIVENIKDLLQQYGIVDKKSFQSIRQFFKSSEFEVIQQKLLYYLQITFPTIGQILICEKKQVENQIQQKSLLQRFTSFFQRKDKKQEKPITKIKINWEGLLLHGALMKGQAIHNIAAEVLMKFFLKIDLQYTPEDLKYKIQDAFRTNQASKKMKNISATTILACINDQKEYRKKLLKISLKQIRDLCQEYFGMILVTIVNRYLVLIQRYCDQTNQKLSINEINLDPLIDKLKINEQFKHEYYEYFGEQLKIESLDGYFKMLNLLQKYKYNHQAQEKYQNASESQYYLNLSSELRNSDYKTLNSIYNKVNLIDPSHFGNGENYKGVVDTLEKFLSKIFGGYFKKISIEKVEEQIKNKQSTQNQKYKKVSFPKKKYQMNYSDLKKYFLALESAELISQTFDFFYNQAKKQSKQFNRPKYVEKYQEICKKFLSEVKNITLREYYNLTNIQMTCTSVDLDDKILRFFNHKSTPDLPVCRCVQMTGSFPVGFKAQRWRKEWGYYNVYLSRKKIEVDLTMHEFTDGGLLANFPIKYLDNADIRRKYFSHQFVQGRTKLYGFGLDYLDASRNILTQTQIRQQIMSNDEIAKQNLMSYLFSQPLKTLFFNLLGKLISSNPGLQTPWAKIYHKIVQKIPLLRFLLKLFYAYPNADRNLNLEVFQNRVTIHQLQKPYILVSDLQTKKQKIKEDQQKWNQRQRCIDHGLIIQYEKFYSKYIKRASQVIKKDLLQKPQKYNKKYIEEIIKNKIENRKLESKQKYAILYEQFKNVVNEDPLYLQGMAITQQRNNQGISESSMCDLLIETFLYILRHQNNRDAVKKFNQKYAYYKYIADEDDFREPQPQNYRKKLNEINFKQLYKQKQLQQLSKHLSFIGIKQLYLNEIVENHSTDEVYKYYLKQATDAQYDFSNMKLYDVTDGIKRFTQFLFLVIKNENFREKCNKERQQRQYQRKIQRQKRGKRQTKQQKRQRQQKQKEQYEQQIKQKKQRSRTIINLVKYNSYEKLLTSQLFQTQKEIGKLTYFQIIKFIRSNSIITEQDKNNKSKVTLEQQFLDFVKEYEIQGNDPREYSIGDNILDDIHNNYLDKTLRIVDEEFTNLTKKKYKAIEKHEFQDLRRNELQKQLQLWGQKEIMQGSKQCFKVLKKNLNLIEDIKQEDKTYFFQLIYSDEPVSRFIMKETQQEKKQRLGNQRYKNAENKVYPISVQEEERLHDQRIKVRKALFNVLIKQKNYSKGVYQAFQKLRKSFQDDIYKFKKQLNQNNNILNQTSKEKIRGKFTKTEEHILKILKIEAIQFLVRNKINMKQTIQKFKKQALYLAKFHRELYTDMQTLFLILKQIIFLLNYLEQIQQKQSPSQLKKLIEHQLKDVYPDFEKIENIQITTSIKQMIAKTYYEMYNKYMQNYGNLSNLQVNQIDQICVSNAFIISFEHVNKIAKIFVLFRNLYMKIKKLIDLEESQHQEQNFCFREIKLIYNSFRIIDNKYFSLPMFTSDWNLTIKSTERKFKEHIKSILDHQNNRKFTNCMFDERSQNFKVKLQKMFDKSSEKTEKINVQLKKIKNRYKDTLQKIKQKLGSEQILQSQFNTTRGLELLEHIMETDNIDPYAQDNFDTHLVLEGVSTANECFGAYYLIVKNLFKLRKQHMNSQKQKQQSKMQALQNANSKREEQEHIKAITCSNFHSIFGFLLVLGKDAETIRKQMYNLKFAATVTQSQQNIDSYFDNQQFFQNTPNRYAKLLQYLEKETKGIFQQLQVKSKLKYGENSVKKELQDIRLIFEHQKENLMEMYGKILDRTCQEIEDITRSDLFLDQQKVNQICKKYAFEYTCDQNKIHNYKNASQESIKSFNQIATNIYKTFGQLLKGIIANSLSNFSPLLLKQENASLIMKGVISQKLFTTYKLKEFIIKQLKEAHLSPSITLSEFYSIKRTIFLNFSVISIDDQRLQFLNKETTPNMPVWAAIIASSSMPFLHKFFQANKQWQPTKFEHFYSFIIDKFFRQNDNVVKANNRIINYISANHISSLPLEILTNKAVNKTIFADDKIRYLKFFAIAFNQNYSNSIPDMKIPKKYLSRGWTDKIKVKLAPTYFSIKNSKFIQKVKEWNKRIFNSSQCGYQQHKNNTYIEEYSTLKYISSYLKHGTLRKTLQTLTQSNDNFNLKWYYQKLIRLPIKIDTLEFTSIIDQKVRNTYTINIPSSKARETIERSYEITSSFINILKDKTIRQSKKYLTKFRVEITCIHHQITGFKREQFKLSFLNHSKWNQNRYNNFVIEYTTQINNKQEKFERAVESQIVWLVEESSKLKIKFYYPLFDQQSPKDSKILFTQIVMNFEDLVKRLPLKDSFDYEVIYGESSIAKDAFNNQKFSLHPKKMNGIELPTDGLFKNMEHKQNGDNKLFVLPSIECELIGKKKQFFESYYIQCSAYKGPTN